jgi:DNA-binding SARP family transcriptional activator
VAFLALSSVQDRDFVAGTLWPESPELHAHASLRTALWRLRRAGADVVCATGTRLMICGVSTDVEELTWYANNLLSDSEIPIDAGGSRLLAGPGLLPGWYEDWVLEARDRMDRLRVQALERLSDRLLAAGLVAPSEQSARAAVRLDPLRESARCCLIRAELADANVAEAVREYRQFRDLLERELGVRPSQRITDLVAPSLQAG